jgi:hypothetical protein
MTIKEQWLRVTNRRGRWKTWLRAFAAAALAGCVTVGQVPPQSTSTTPIVIADGLPRDLVDSPLPLRLGESNYVFTQWQSGSVAVGLLLGPIGVAGNVAFVQAKTKERGEPLIPVFEKPELNLNIGAAVGKMNRPNIVASSVDGKPLKNTYVLYPYVMIHELENRELQPTVMLRATLTGPNGQNTWLRLYTRPLPVKFRKEQVLETSSLPDREAFLASVTDGVVELVHSFLQSNAR